MSTAMDRFNDALNKYQILGEPQQAEDRDERLVKALELLAASASKQEEGEKAAGSVHSAITLHNGNGIFGGSGLERDVISAHSCRL